MLPIGNDKMIIVFAIIVVIVILGFGINYFVKKTVQNELLKLKKRKHRKIVRQMQHINQYKNQHYQEQTDQNVDMDSYIDPAQQYNDDQDEINNDGANRRLKQNDIHQRDLIGA